MKGSWGSLLTICQCPYQHTWHGFWPSFIDVGTRILVEVVGGVLHEVGERFRRWLSFGDVGAWILIDDIRGGAA